MIDRAVLNNGMRFIGMPLKNFSSVTLGVFIKVGSMDEPEEINGISHFIEHMLFKGTTSLSGKEIAFAIDGIGGELNAFTMRECTAVYTEVLEKYVGDAVKIIADMIENPTFPDEEIEKEKAVIIDELTYYEDSPEDLVDDSLHLVSFKGTKLEQPVAGTVAHINELNRDKIKSFFDSHYIPENIVIAAGGNYDFKELIDLLNKSFTKTSLAKPLERKEYNSDSFKPGFAHTRKNIELNHFSLGIPAISFDSPELYTFLVLNNIIGGSISSRLFQRVREESGLTYSIDSSPLFYSNLGIINIYFTALGEHTDRLMQIMSEELSSFKNLSATSDEVERSKVQILSSYLMGLEHSDEIMNWLGKAELLGDPIRDKKETLAMLEEVSVKDVNDLSRRIFSNNGISFSSIGKILKKDSHKMYNSFRESMKG